MRTVVVLLLHALLSESKSCGFVTEWILAVGGYRILLQASPVCPTGCSQTQLPLTCPYSNVWDQQGHIRQNSVSHIFIR